MGDHQPFPNCPQGCVVEFSQADLALPDPTPTVTISSIGGANMAFTESGDMWMVTGGGGVPGTPYCFGTPCTNQLVEFTKPQLSTSGSPAPAITINTTAADASGSMFGPYGVAVAPPVTCGSPTSTSRLPSSTASTSCPDRGRPPPGGRSAVPTLR